MSPCAKSKHRITNSIGRHRVNSGTFSVLFVVVVESEGINTCPLLQMIPMSSPEELKTPPTEEPFQKDVDAMHITGRMLHDVKAPAGLMSDKYH